MPKPATTNCPVCVWKRGTDCAYWGMPIARVTDPENKGLICPDPKKVRR